MATRGGGAYLCRRVLLSQDASRSRFPPVTRATRVRPRLWRSILAHFCSRWAACAGVLRVCGGVGVLVGPVGWCWGGGWGWCGVGRACVALRLAGWRRSAGFFWRVRVFVVGRFEEFFWRGPWLAARLRATTESGRVCPTVRLICLAFVGVECGCLK